MLSERVDSMSKTALTCVFGCVCVCGVYVYCVCVRVCVWCDSKTILNSLEADQGWSERLKDSK